jgi:hypothetical protein
MILYNYSSHMLQLSDCFSFPCSSCCRIAFRAHNYPISGVLEVEPCQFPGFNFLNGLSTA